MPRRDPLVTLKQMRDHAREAMEMARGRKREDLDRDRMLNLAIVRLLEIVGEAASRVPPEVREKHSSIPWPQIIGLRNRLIHAYDEMDLDILWEILRSDIPALLEDLDQAIKEGD